MQHESILNSYTSKELDEMLREAEAEARVEKIKDICCEKNSLELLLEG